MMHLPSTLPISFEFFPPKTPAGLKTLRQSAAELAALAPEFFSVTFGAGGSTREGTIATVAELQTLGVPVAPHLACVGLSKAELVTILKLYESLGIKRIVALRGDLPSGMGQNGELAHSNTLVALVRETMSAQVCIEVAAYPEVHPQAKNARDDLLNLKKKIAAGANSAITQYFFNADAYFYFVDECLKAGITIPIIPGIMPITHFDKLVRFSARCGAEIPQWIHRRLESYSDNAEAIQAFGLDVVGRLCDQLISRGAPGLHFYTLNQADASLKIVKQLKNKFLAPSASSL